MRQLTITLFAIGLSTQAALAAPATQAEADRLTSVFQTYLGTLPGAVSIVPDGDDYALSIDPNAYLALIPQGEATEIIESIQMDAFDMRLTDLGGGKWRVTQDEPWRMSLAIADVMDFDMVMDRVKYDGIWDQDLLAFETYTSEVDGLVTTSRTMGPDGAVIQEDTQTYATMRYSGASRRGTNGGVDTDVNSQFLGMQQTSLVQGFGETISINMSAERYSTDSTITGFQVAPMLAMIAQGVAVAQSGDPESLDLAAMQEDLRGHLHDFLPVFENVDATFNLDNLLVETPFGGGSIANISGAFDVNGLVDVGLYDIEMALSGLTVSADAIPSFYEPLIPSDLTLDLRVSRYSLNTPARTVIDSFDVMTPEVIDRMVLFQLIPQLLPTGQVGIDVGPSNVTAPAYTLDLQGGGTVGLTGTTQGTANISLEGIDRLTEALNAMPPEMIGQALGPLGLAQGLAQRGDDGTLLWDLELNMPGSLMVNGNEMLPQ